MCSFFLTLFNFFPAGPSYGWLHMFCEVKSSKWVHSEGVTARLWVCKGDTAGQEQWFSVVGWTVSPRGIRQCLRRFLLSQLGDDTGRHRPLVGRAGGTAKYRLIEQTPQHRTTQAKTPVVPGLRMAWWGDEDRSSSGRRPRVTQTHTAEVLKVLGSSKDTQEPTGS